jgi:NTE family protein
VRLNVFQTIFRLLLLGLFFVLSSNTSSAESTCQPSSLQKPLHEVRTALVFSGGGAKGAYEAGAAHLFVTQGIPLVLVAGSSAGALNAAMVSAGQVDDLQTVWQSLSKEQIYQLRASIWLSGFLPGWLTLWRLNHAGSLFDAAPLRTLLDERVDLKRIQSSSIRLFILTADLANWRKRSFDNQSVTMDALLAAVAVPGAFQPIEIEGERLVDGGLIGRAPVIDALEIAHRDVERVIVIMSYAEGEGGEPPVTIRRALESAFEMAQTHQIIRDVELARLKFPSVEIQLLQPSQPLNLAPLDFSSGRLVDLIALGKHDALECLKRLGYQP